MFFYLKIVTVFIFQDRWAESIETLQSDISYLISDSFFTAAGTIYLGPFHPHYRSVFFEKISEKIVESQKIKVIFFFFILPNIISSG